MGSCFEILTLPAKVVPSAPLSDDDFLSFARASEPYRIEMNAEGEIIVMTPTGAEGGNLEGYIFRELDFWVERAGNGFAVNSNTAFRLPDKSIRIPDAAWISPERWDSLSKEQKKKFPPFCPDFVVELRSESDRAKTLERKMNVWMANGAHLAWLIDPIRKLAKVYRPGVKSETLIQPEFLDGEGPVGGFRLKMERFWA